MCLGRQRARHERKQRGKAEEESIRKTSIQNERDNKEIKERYIR